MITVAWCISLLLCTPQAFIFQGDKCQANFAPGWGVKAYVLWFSVSNFFIPLCILFFCYSRICYDIWNNGKQKKLEEKATQNEFGEPKKKKAFKKWIKNLGPNSNRRESQGLMPPKMDPDGGPRTTSEVLEDPNAIMAIEKLQRRESTSSSDSSIESADQNIHKVSNGSHLSCNHSKVCEKCAQNLATRHFKTRQVKYNYLYSANPAKSRE